MVLLSLITGRNRDWGWMDGGIISISSSEWFQHAEMKQQTQETSQANGEEIGKREKDINSK